MVTSRVGLRSPRVLEEGYAVRHALLRFISGGLYALPASPLITQRVTLWVITLAGLSAEQIGKDYFLLLFFDSAPAELDRGGSWRYPRDLHFTARTATKEHE